jgi:hypothetical protein
MRLKMVNSVTLVVIHNVDRGTPPNSVTVGRLASAGLLNPTFESSRYVLESKKRG